MKKAYLSFLIILILSSCQDASGGFMITNGEFTVERLSLTHDEQKIANLTSDIVEKFLFRKDKIYDINIYFYQNGLLENVNGMMTRIERDDFRGAENAGGIISEVHHIQNIGGIIEMDTKGSDEILYIAGRQDGDIGFSWQFSHSGMNARFPAADIYDDANYAMARGPNYKMARTPEQEQFLMEKGKEYLLVYAAYYEGDVSAELFYNWDMLENKEEALSEFAYAYIITVQFSN